MTFISSNISITNRVEEAALFFYNGELSRRIEIISPILKPIEQQIFSRFVGLLISPAALLEMAVHVVILPFTVVYAVGKSIYFRKCDFLLPWQHIQRIRDAVFPILFGSLFGLIHPYFGTYAAEPTKKHIATGILLSGTDTEHFDSVCSPLTTMSEISALLTQISPELKISEKEKKLLNQVSFWEGEFEKIQSIDFFTLNLTFKIGKHIQKSIKQADLPRILKELLKRVALVTYPIFVALDLIVFAFATPVSLGALIVKVVGGQSPAYLEKAWTPEVLIYNIVKVPLFLISVTVGFLVGLVHPKTGLLCAKYPIEWMAAVPFFVKMLGIKWRLYWMKKGDLILLPSVQNWREELRSKKLRLLPSYGSHMRYLLVEKVDDNHYQAELIERGKLHRKTDPFNRTEIGQILQTTLSLRYKFGENNDRILSVYYQKDSIIKLGNQKGINNCVVTNLFAVIEVLCSKFGKNHFLKICSEVKTQAIFRYYVYARDFYPFAQTSQVLTEIKYIFSRKI